jgi:hypothetical protein
MILVNHCLRIIWESQYKYKLKKGSKILPFKFWCIENPANGFLKYFLGKPFFTYNHYEYGELISKKTGLWGFFNNPIKPLLFNQVVKNSVEDAFWNIKDKKERMNLRSKCPYSFAKAFFEANQ